MAFNSQMEIPSAALEDFKSFLHLLQLKYPVASGLLNRIYMHWTVSRYCDEFPDYNAEVIILNNKCELVITGNPQDNAPGLNNNPIHSHTWHRNTGAVGISIAGMLGATVDNFGSYAPTEMELLYLCGGVAALGKAYDIDVNGTVSQGSAHLDNNDQTVNTKGEFNVITHGEAAVIDAYPNERWDLGVLEPLPFGVSLTPAMRVTSGNKLRECAHRIKLML